MKTIKLTRGLKTLVDDDIYERVSLFSWYAHKSYKGRFYAARRAREGEEIYPRYKFVYLHRDILLPRRGEIVDHINADTLDNRKANLRICTPSQNLSNRGKTENNTSGYKGVTWDKRRMKWVAQIVHKNKNHHIGRFDTKDKAASAYNEYAKKYHGEFAVLNNVE
jgi:hypothetical protein